MEDNDLSTEADGFEETREITRDHIAKYIFQHYFRQQAELMLKKKWKFVTELKKVLIRLLSI